MGVKPLNLFSRGCKFFFQGLPGWDFRILLPRFLAMPKFLSFSEAKVAQPGTICLISDDSDFRSGGGRETRGTKLTKKWGRFLPGKKGGFVVEKEPPELEGFPRSARVVLFGCLE